MLGRNSLLLSDESLEQVVQEGCACPSPGSVQGRVGWVSEQPGLVGGIPPHGSGGRCFKVPSNLNCFMVLFLVAKTTEEILEYKSFSRY